LSFHLDDLDDLDEETLTKRLKLFEECGTPAQDNRQLLSEFGAADAESVVWLNKVHCDELLTLLQGALDNAPHGCHAYTLVSHSLIRVFGAVGHEHLDAHTRLENIQLRR
jgi:hypothetical protein